MKKFTALFLCGIMILSLTGCYEKKIVVARQIDPSPYSGENEVIEFDMEQTREDCEALINEGDYPHKVYIDFQVDEEAQVVGLAVAVDDECSDEEALQYGTDYIKAFNDAMATQDFRFATSDEGYYGGFFDIFGIELYLFRISDEQDPDKYITHQIIEAGTNDPVQAL